MASISRFQPRSYGQLCLQERAGRRIRCLTCQRRCELIPGGLGWCQTRAHQDGTLMTLIYGALSSLSANPIEKKPFYHFHPGTRALTSGSWSCNFVCPWCQNYHISKTAPGRGRSLSVLPDEFVTRATSLGCEGTSISFNEPTLSLEWSLDVFRLARERGLYNTYVTNGYMTPEALQLLVEAGLDAMNVDVKGDCRDRVGATARGLTWKKCGATADWHARRACTWRSPPWSSPVLTTGTRCWGLSRSAFSPSWGQKPPGTSAAIIPPIASPPRPRRRRP